MFEYSQTSKNKLETCHPDLIKLFNEVIKHVDCTIVCGHRDEKEQNRVYREGNSAKQWPDSKHNVYPSEAIDAVVYISDHGPVWEEKQAYRFNGYVTRLAEEMDIQIRSGADWDEDWDVNDQELLDPYHFEVINDSR